MAIGDGYEGMTKDGRLPEDSTTPTGITSGIYNI